MDMPCRSCAFCRESNLHVSSDTGTGDIVVHCNWNFPLKGHSILMYGVDNEEVGRDICSRYEHKGFDW